MFRIKRRTTVSFLLSRGFKQSPLWNSSTCRLFFPDYVRAAPPLPPPAAVHRQTQLRLNVNPGKTGPDPQGRGETEETTTRARRESFEHELATLLINTAPVDYRYELNRRKEGRGRIMLPDDSWIGLASIISYLPAVHTPRAFRRYLITNSFCIPPDLPVDYVEMIYTACKLSRIERDSTGLGYTTE